MLRSTAAATLRITQAEFKESLFAIRPVPRNAPLTFGIAVSGGVDSMALAKLCAECLPNPGRTQLQAFVVDHQLREGSEKEAMWVKEQLKEHVNIRAAVLTLNWDKSELTKKDESAARVLRYRALGQACKKHKITNLLTAHHQDDQAETVLMRLLQGRVGFGLRGIHAEARIPECEHLWGVYESGRPVAFSRPHGAWVPRAAVLAEQRPSDESEGPVKQQRMFVEAGGVRLLRPLLPFPKERLVATCHELNVPWVEDPTNADPGHTTRNALRKLLTEPERLPPVLRRESLIAVAARVEVRRREIAAEAEALFYQCKCQLDLRSAKLEVEVPGSACTALGDPARADAATVAALFFERVLQLVPVEKNRSLGQLQPLLENYFPRLLSHEDDAPTPEFASSMPASLTTFAAGRTVTYLGRPASSPTTPPTSLEQHPGLHLFITPAPPISRQAYRHKHVVAPNSSNRRAIPFHQHWVQIANNTDRTITLRALSHRDNIASLLRADRSKTPGGQLKRLRAAARAPHYAGLPALFVDADKDRIKPDADESGASAAEDGAAGANDTPEPEAAPSPPSRLVGLPTLRIWDPDFHPPRLQVMVRYRAVAAETSPPGSAAPPPRECPAGDFVGQRRLAVVPACWHTDERAGAEGGGAQVQAVGEGDGEGDQGYQDADWWGDIDEAVAKDMRRAQRERARMMRAGDGVGPLVEGENWWEEEVEGERVVKQKGEGESKGREGKGEV